MPANFQARPVSLPKTMGTSTISTECDSDFCPCLVCAFREIWHEVFPPSPSTKGHAMLPTHDEAEYLSDADADLHANRHWSLPALFDYGHAVRDEDIARQETRRLRRARDAREWLMVRCLAIGLFVGLFIGGICSAMVVRGDADRDAAIAVDACTARIGGIR